MRLGLAILTIMLPLWALSAPIPGTGSSVLTDPSKGIFFHGFGFRIQSIRPGWRAVANSKTGSDAFRFEPLSKNASREASISLHLEKLNNTSNLETYARKWMKEYPSYGFEVLGTKGVLLNGDKSLLVDLTQNQKNRQIRQAILQNKNKVVVVTCLDRKDQFNDTLTACNELLKSFQWVSFE